MPPDWQGDILKRIPLLNYHLEKKKANLHNLKLMHPKYQNTMLIMKTSFGH